MQDAAVLIDENRHHLLFHHEIFCSAEFLTFKENLKVAMKGEIPPKETRLQQAMPDMLMRVDGVSESLQADIQLVRDWVEQSLETTNSIVSSFRDIISGRVPFYLNTGVPPKVSECVTNEEFILARATPSIDESAQNDVLLSAVPVYKMSRSLVCVTDVWKEYKVGIGGNPSVVSLDRDYKMLGEGLLLRGSFTPIYFCSTSKLRLWLKS